MSSQLRHVSTIGKNLLSSNISSRCPHSMVNFRSLTAEVGSGVWGAPANFNEFRVLALLLQRRHSLEASQILHDVWMFPGLVHYEFCQVQNSSLALSFNGSITARHSSSRHQPKFAARYTEQNYGTLAEGTTYIGLGGYHVGHRPAF